ncbi:MAG: methyl-accepting chemotaxis protein [Tateyamaria sp.]
MPHSSREKPTAPLSRELQLQCRALAAVPHEFRAVGTWLNYNCALVPQMDDTDSRARLLEDMRMARAALDAVMAYFDPDAELPDFHPEAVAWFRNCLQKAPHAADPFRVTACMLIKLQHTIETDPGAALPLHRETSDYIIKSLAPEITALLSILNTALEAQEDQRKRWVKHLRMDASDAVSRIRSISKMVRLISLNASVEAARAGDAGKSFGVIASEVKALSEAIQTSANHVTETVNDLSDRL